MNQKNRIEPTFGSANEAIRPTPVMDENANNTLERINKSSEVLTNLASKEMKVESEVKTEPKATISPFVSVKTNNAPAHTFSRPLNRPANAFQNSATAEEIPQVHQAGVSSQNVQASIPQSVAPAASGMISAHPHLQKVEPTDTPAVKPNMERETPTATEAGSTLDNKKENMPKVPSKFRRLFVVILLALLGGVAIWLLKPNTPKTVAELENQSQSNSLPIEFRPVNEEEAKAAEAREAEALAQQQAQQQAQQVVEPQSAQQAEGSVSISGDNNATIGEQAQNVPQAEGNAPSTEITINQEGVIANANNESIAPAAKPSVVKVVKPNSQGSVIYQPERAKARTEKNITVEKKAEQPKIKAMTATEYKAKVEKNARMDQLIQNVESGKPAVTRVAPVATAQKVVAMAAPAQSNAVVSSKTMTVPKSTSLMQVFRDNGLNISDVNAMSRANGIVSNLKVNEKITVRLDKNNRVVEMSIGSGGRFTRQADGSYRFQ